MGVSYSLMPVTVNFFPRGVAKTPRLPALQEGGCDSPTCRRCWQKESASVVALGKDGHNEWLAKSRRLENGKQEQSKRVSAERAMD